MEERTPGVSPLDPLFQGRSLLARSVLGWETQRNDSTYSRGPCTGPDLEAFFWESVSCWIFVQSKIQQKIVSPKNAVPNLVWCTSARKRWSQRAPTQKNERAPASGLKRPGAGQNPAILSPCFLIRKQGPRRVGGATGRCAPRLVPEAGHLGYVLRGQDPGPTFQPPSGLALTGPPPEAGKSPDHR